jgi:hypothetical protein
MAYQTGGCRDMIALSWPFDYLPCAAVTHLRRLPPATISDIQLQNKGFGARGDPDFPSVRFLIPELRLGKCESPNSTGKKVRHVGPVPRRGYL